ncbi:Dyp-type peroxidase [Aestuariicella sp. G3-2]|uniref:Dyp-type peroxidase n=1 Tax=Pseudomaricurvus albidus TaxID=2842452 RepID=UPI001C0B87C0|nr:Dyp-type peroxidase [Aestuariicella albida]MBU3069433.1 Dyp-type peroxidase [Aestuariicella albida]
MASPQSGILAPVPGHGIYLSFDRLLGADSDAVRKVLARVAETVDGESVVLGLGAPLLQSLQVEVAGIKPFPTMMAAGVNVPATQHDLWLWVREDDEGEAFHRAAALIQVLEDGFELAFRVDGFKYREGRDLTGYVDGTENPMGDEALEAAIVGSGEPLAGSSFVAVQLWQHDFGAFHGMEQTQKDHVIGRRLSDNVELEDAPESAHVKRTAQEDFDPQAFVLRRSTSWREGTSGGLHFVAFGCSFYAFEAQMQRMIGVEDGIVDGLFQISRPLTGEYYWCPAVLNGVLDLSPLSM